MCITILKNISHLYLTWKVDATLSSVTTRLTSEGHICFYCGFTDQESLDFRPYKRFPKTINPGLETRAQSLWQAQARGIVCAVKTGKSHLNKDQE